jgi:aminopeptidase N
MMPARHRLHAVIMCLSAAAAPGSEPFSFDSAPGRLPKGVVPIDYAVSIQPDLAALSFDGAETIVLEFRVATARVQFNTLNQSLHDVIFDGQPVHEVVTDDAAQLTTLTLASPAAPGRHMLSLSFHGRLETMARGLFVQPFVGSDGRPNVVLSTKLESTEARRMFPCWDEPAFRSTFELTMTVPRRWAVVSNMPVMHRETRGALASTTFWRSPKMPSYLIEFTGGELDSIGAQSDGVSLGIWSVRGRQKEGRTALHNAQIILADYDEYFGYRFPLPKLDSIAVPGGFAGAMENWGAITYNDQLLLLTPASTMATRQTAFSVQAHEMAHQWNGDLVTMGWWDDIWLNESFASWMASKETERRNPDWHWWEGKDADKEDAMSADAFAASHAIQQPVTDELLATAAFDPQITYRKGQSILRMFEASLGPEVFRDGIRSYLRAHAFSNATTADLWEALGAASGQEVRRSLAGWTEQPGFPLISVDSVCDADGHRAIRFSQRRFLLDGTDPGSSHWSVPLQIRAGNAPPRSLLLTQDQQSTEGGLCGEPLSVNADAIGYYRVRYDADTRAVLLRSLGMLPRGDRIALLDDQWALARAGMEPLPAYLDMVDSLHEVIDARSWEQIADALEIIEFDERGSTGHDAFARYARAVLAPVFAQLGWDAHAREAPDLQRLRRHVISDLGEWGDESVIEQARVRFHAFLHDRRAISPDDQAMILSLVARYADADTFEQLHAIARSTRDEAEMRRYFGAMMAVSDAALADRAVQIALSDEIPPQAGSLRLGLIVRIAEDHPALSWGAFTRNAAALLAPFARYVPLISAQQVPGWYWKGVPLPAIESWVREQVPAEMSANIERGLAAARFRQQEQARLLPAADAFVRDRVDPADRATAAAQTQPLPRACRQTPCRWRQPG